MSTAPDDPTVPMPTDDTAPVRDGSGRRRWVVVAAVALLAVGLIGFLAGRSTAPQESALPDDASVEELLTEAVALHSGGVIDEAAKRYEAILAVEPDNVLALYNLGQITQQRGVLPTAIEYYDRALAADPTFSTAAFNRAIALRDLGRTDEAIAAFQALLDANPDSVGALFNLGNLYISLGDAERGVPLVNRAVELDPSLRGD